MPLHYSNGPNCQRVYMLTYKSRMLLKSVLRKEAIFDGRLTRYEWAHKALYTLMNAQQMEYADK